MLTNSVEISSILGSDYDQLLDKYNLVSQILSVQENESLELKQLKLFVETDFRKFSNRQNSMSKEGDARIYLQTIIKELELLTSFPDIYNKSIIAVGGGFSSGKSEFISSFFEENTIKLPIGILPVTAIPTYVIHGEHNTIKGFSRNGGSIDIDKNLYAELSHDYIKNFNFNLKDIMPMMAIRTQLKDISEICFIDTPGYNPADVDGYTSEDEDTAYEYLKRSNSLIWVIGLDSNGTISTKDLEFLDNLKLNNKKLYIVANKADLRSEGDLEDILTNIKETFEDYDIQISGISAFSSINKHEYMYRKKDLVSFLKEQNNIKLIKERVLIGINNIMNKYIDDIKKDINKSKVFIHQLNSLELDLLEAGNNITSKNFQDRLYKLKKAFSANKLKADLINAKKIKASLNQYILTIYSNLNQNV